MPLLDWLNKQDAVRTVQKVPYRLLEAVPELSAGDANAENLLIQGDNLEALKALLPLYAGKVKCIYIDPPYNTRSAFTHYDDNLEHSLWLSLMYPRLELLRELLAEDGSIWVSIDDNEAHYLKVMMDEVFGRGNFVANVIWQKKASPQANSVWLSDSHDHIICFAKNKDAWCPKLLKRTEAADARFSNPDNDPRGVWTSGDFTISLTGGQRGAQFAKTGQSNNLFEITTPSGRKLWPTKGRCWGSTEERFLELYKDNRIWFGKNGSNVPRIKRFLSEVQDGIVCTTIWLRSEVGDNQISKKEVMAFNQEDVFSTPKPESLIERIFEVATNSNDLILDSFLGSGTTAAVAHKMGRRYIGIEMGEHAQTHCQPRLKKVVEGEQGGISQAVNWQGGGGFHYFRLGETIFDEYGSIHHNVRFAALAAHIWFCETRVPLAKPADTPLLGVHDNTAYYLLYNGILGDRRPQSGNVLTQSVLDALPSHDGRKIIYGEASRFQKARLEVENIVFKQIPYDVRAV
ncbi:site-specific DNA-methyltransferase [Methylomonas rivi]|uniref:Site-specific DNA-methyltransferase n=1 Tax=Methylomonas rivi TaxID=2952226 RepID=A0ABT1U2V0_9GAMM|nr:site-specific DNA-methyltransferase [Methylomonas sp. WSC-6]MCQ8128161.1 site-specific DNA-methyltransferase [Methylomonas sp. WSC-6]